MFFHQRFIPGLAIYSYLVGDEKTKQAAVIDPTRDVDYWLQIAQQQGLQITHILETHVHADFISGSRELKARLNNQPQIHASNMGGPEWTAAYADHQTADGDEIKMGDVRLQAVHTPGHTLEHLSWALYDDSRSKETPWLMFTGDFLFVGDVGRPDLLGEEAQKTLAHQLYQSVFGRLPVVPDFTEIFPGHGAGSLCGKAIGSRSASTVGYERQFNPSLVDKSEQQWVADLMSQMPLAPKYFPRMKQINRQGPRVLGAELPGQRAIDAETVHRRTCTNCQIVDVRSKEAFAAAHIAGSINIPLADNLATWAGWVLDYDRPILLVLDNPAQMAEVTTHLIRVGLDEVHGFLDGGIDAWQTKGLPLDSLSTMSVHDLQQQLVGDITVLDVRTDGEWNRGHIDGAIHIHGGVLQDHFDDIPRDKPVAVVCGSGYRAAIAASFLKREGYQSVTNVMGGMSAWQSANLPTANYVSTCERCRL